MLHHGAQVLKIEQQQAIVVGDLEDELEHAGLRVVEVEQAGEQDRPHVRDRRPHRVALLASDVPESDGETRRRPVGDAERVEPLAQFRASDAGRGQPRKVALDVGHEHRHADAGEAFGQYLQSDGFAGAGGASDQTVAIGEGG